MGIVGKTNKIAAEFLCPIKKNPVLLSAPYTSAKPVGSLLMNGNALAENLAVVQQKFRAVAK